MNEQQPKETLKDRLANMDMNNIHLLREEELPSFDELISDPDGPKYVGALLHQTRLHQNVIHINEFKQYEPLFRWSGREELGDQEYGRLSIEYAQRISRFDPVYIVGDENEVLFVLPPVFNRTDTMNSLGATGVNISQAFINACLLPDEVSTEKRAKYGKIYEDLFKLAQNEKVHEHHKKIAAEMSEEVLKQTRAQALKEMQESEIQDISPSELKEIQSGTSSTPESENLPYGGDEDVRYM